MPTWLPPKKLFVLFFVWVVIFIYSVAASYIYFSLSKVVVTPSPLPLWTPTVSPSINPSPRSPDNSINILLIGYGGGNHSGGNLSDVLQVLHINPDTKTTHLISVPRDTWVPLPTTSGEEYFKVNTAYTVSGEMAKFAVSKVIGLPIHYFAAIDFSGFSKTIDTLGGVDVMVPVTFDDYFYPIKGKEEELCDKSPEEMVAIHATMSGYTLEQQFTCRYEHLHFDKGPNHMDGLTALKFVRSRHSTEHGGDFARSERQKEVLLALKQKAISLGALNDVVSFVNNFGNSVRTDIAPSELEKIIKKIGNINDYKVTQTVLSIDNVFNQGTSSKGAYILIPKEGNNTWTGIHKFVLEQIN